MTLEQKIRDVLGRLEALSEAPAGNLEAHIGRSAPDSAVPGGVTLRVLGDERERSRSLHDWYRTQFERAVGNPSRLLSLYLAAEREYLRRVDPTIHNQTAEKGSILAYSQDGATVESLAGEQMIQEFEGVHALDVAVIEGKTEAWVRKVREQHGRNPEDGRPRSTFLDLSEEDRCRKVAALANRGLSQRKAAKRLGVGKTTIVRYWPEPIAA